MSFSKTVLRLLARTPVYPRSVQYARYRSTATQLPSDAENARSSLSKSLTSRIDKLQTSFLFAGQRLNDLTGYSGIEKLKNQIELQEREVSRTIELVKEAKKAYEEAIRTRSESQREVNELLQRKNSWSGSDLERFTMLFRDDHSNSQNEERCQRALGDSEVKVDQARTDLGNMILARYHEEQIWSDKIRRASTWGTWGLMGFNIFLFIIVQLGLEPWKRRRLVGSFEDKVRQVVQEERAALVADRERLENSPRGVVDAFDSTDFMTDADHAAYPFDHATTRIGFEESSIDRHADSMEQAVETEEIDFAAPSPDRLQASFEGTEHATELLPNRHPRAGTSAMLSLPHSLRGIRSYLSYMSTSLRGLTLSLRDSVLRSWSRALSAERSQLRVEDVTSACFASGLVGIAVGLLFRH